MTRRNIDIPDDLWHWVSVEAAKQGKSKRQLVVELLEFGRRQLGQEPTRPDGAKFEQFWEK